MNWWRGLFGGGGPGRSAQRPLLAPHPAGARAMLAQWACPDGHGLHVRRAGSVPGGCPAPEAHHGGAGIVDVFHAACAGGEFSAELFFDVAHADAPLAAEPPRGLKLRAEPRPISLYYHDRAPAWRLRTVQPSRFREVRYQLKTRLFLLPEGALIGTLLNLYDIPNQPYFIHRVMDISDPEVAGYVEACGRRGCLTAVFEARGEERGFRREIDLDGAAWLTHLLRGRAHNARISPDGAKALEAFLEVFHRVSRERGVDSAWAEIERRCAQHPK